MIDPAPMFVRSPISASPMYERCGTLAPSPTTVFLTPRTCPPSPSLEHGAGAKVTERAYRAYGPSWRRSRRRAGRSRPRADAFVPRRTVNGWTTESGSHVTLGSIQADAGSTIVTPASMCAG